MKKGLDDAAKGNAGNGKTIGGKAIFWNMVGSVCYSASSFLFLMVVTRTLGASVGGFFSLCYATAQLLLTVGRFGVRTFQSTDLLSAYSFREYRLFRLLTVLLMILSGVVYGWYTFSGTERLCCALIVAMKAADAVEDVYHGNLQQHYEIGLMGKLLALRNVATTVCFAIGVMAFRDLTKACLLSAAFSLSASFFLNRIGTKRAGLAIGKIPPILEGDDGELLPEKVWALAVKCAPLFAGTFLSLYLYNIPKYAMAGVLSAEYQTYYSVLFMPSFVISLMCEFLFKPQLTLLAEYWQGRQTKRFLTSFLKLFFGIVGMGAFVLLGGVTIGWRILGFVYKVNLSSFVGEFALLLVGGIFSGATYMVSNLLIAIRRDRAILPAYLSVAILFRLVVGTLVRHLGMAGACLSYLGSSATLFAIFGVSLYLQVHGRRE